MFLLPVIGLGQTLTVSGTIVDADTAQPVPFAHVFVNNTTQVTISDINGKFRLDGVMGSNPQVIVTFLGYESWSQSLTTRSKELRLTIKLKPSVVALDQVEVAATIDKQWNRQLKVFKKQFLGETKSARSCELVNPWVLDFEKKSGNFIANAGQPLKIINQTLGYHLTFYLQHFEAAGDQFAIVGPVRFEEMQDDSRSEAWVGNRLKAYEGSTKHFLKCLWKNNFKEKSFRIYRSVNALEAEERTPYFERDLGKRVKELKREDLIRDDARDGIVLVTMRPLEVHFESGQDFEQVYKDIIHQVSWIQSSSGQIRFDSTGNILNPQEVTVSGYWNKLRVADLLPLNYEPAAGATQSEEKESIRFITDRDLYAAGEQLWYAGLVEGLGHRAGAVHCQLVDSTNRLVGERVDPVEGRIATGFFRLPEGYYGKAYLKAFTKATYSKGEAYVKPILVQSARASCLSTVGDANLALGWRYDSLAAREQLAVWVTDTDGDTLKGNFIVSVSAVGMHCDCLSGKQQSFDLASASLLDDGIPRGQVVGSTGKALAGRIVFFTSDLQYSVERSLDESGRFQLDDVISYDSLAWLAQMFDTKEKPVKDFSIKWQKGSEAGAIPLIASAANCIQPPPPSAVTVNRERPTPPNEEFKLADSTRLLKEVTIRGRRIEGERAPNTSFRSFGTPQYTVSGAELAAAPVGTNLINSLASRVPGLVIDEAVSSWTGNQTKIVIRGTSTYKTNEDPLLIIDGMPMGDFQLAMEILQTIPLTDIDKVEVRTGLSPMQGLKGGNGVIAVYTKRSSTRATSGSAQSAFVKSVQLSGYSSPGIFHADEGSLYWEPSANFSTGVHLITLNEPAAMIDIRVAGFNPAGEYIEVSRRLSLNRE